MLNKHVAQKIMSRQKNERRKNQEEIFYSEVNFVIRKKRGSNSVNDRWENSGNEMGIEMQLTETQMCANH